MANTVDPDQMRHWQKVASDLGLHCLLRPVSIFRLITVCLFVLKFYRPVNPMGSCRAWSVYLTMHLLGRLSPLSS